MSILNVENLQILCMGFGLFSLMLLVLNRRWSRQLRYVVKLGLEVEDQLNQKALEIDSLKKKLADRDDRLQKNILVLEKSEAKLLVAHKKLEEMRDQSDSKAMNEREELAHAVRHNDHLTEQVVALTAQLAEVFSEKKELQLKLDASLQKLAQKAKAKVDIDELNHTKNRATRLENEVKDKERALASIRTQFEEGRKLLETESKKKVSQFKDLYLSMKNLRDLADDRAASLEIAGSKLAHWVIEKQSSSKTNDVKPDVQALSPQKLIYTALLLSGQKAHLEFDQEELGRNQSSESNARV